MNEAPEPTPPALLTLTLSPVTLANLAGSCALGLSLIEKTPNPRAFPLSDTTALVGQMIAVVEEDRLLCLNKFELTDTQLCQLALCAHVGIAEANRTREHHPETPAGMFEEQVIRDARQALCLLLTTHGNRAAAQGMVNRWIDALGFVPLQAAQA